jgi:hypothetical protein
VRLRPSWQRRWRLRPPSLLRAWVGLWCLRPLWRSLFFLRRWWVRLAVLREEASGCSFFPAGLWCPLWGLLFVPSLVFWFL